MGYIQKKNTRIDLSTIGTDSSGNPFFVEIVNMKMLSYEDRQQFTDLGKSISDSGNTEKVASLKEVLKRLILSWNLISIDDELPLPIPSQDPASLNKVPGEALDRIFIAMAKGISAEDQAAKNSLPQSDKSSENVQLQRTSTSEDTTN